MEGWDEIENDLRRMFRSMGFRARIDFDPEDIVQDVWAIAKEHYDPVKGSLYAFCTQVGHNLIRKMAERERVYTRAVRADVTAFLVGSENEPGVEEQAVEGLIAQETWEEARQPKWLILRSLMDHQYSTEAQVLWVIYRYIQKFDEVPTDTFVAKALGLRRATIGPALKRIVRLVTVLEGNPQIQAAIAAGQPVVIAKQYAPRRRPCPGSKAQPTS